MKSRIPYRCRACSTVHRVELLVDNDDDAADADMTEENDWGTLEADGPSGQQSLDVGRESRATADRESRTEGTDEFADDRDGVSAAGEQSTVAPDRADNGQRSLEGDVAETNPEWEESE